MLETLIKELQYLIGILVAVLLGFAIGFERKLRYKEAGIRTHTIVCVGAALIMVVSKYAFEGQQADASRVAAQIVRIAFRNTEDESTKVKELFDAEHFNSLSIKREGENTVYHAVLNTDKEYSSQMLNKIMADNPFILSVERCDEE